MVLAQKQKLCVGKQSAVTRGEMDRKMVRVQIRVFKVVLAAIA